MRAVRSAAAGMLPAAALFFSGCESRGGVPADSLPPGYIVDSILPAEEALRRFRAGLDSAIALDGAASRTALLERFDRAIASRDTAALRALAVDRREFAYLVYPESRLSRPPYRQPPEIAWLMLQQASASGLRKLLARADSLRVLSHACSDSAQVEGRMRTYFGCQTRVRMLSGGERTLRLTGRLVELGGRWKFVGYDGDL